jgi:hypothetical protein
MLKSDVTRCPGGVGDWPRLHEDGLWLWLAHRQAESDLHPSDKTTLIRSAQKTPISAAALR